MAKVADYFSSKSPIHTVTYDEQKQMKTNDSIKSVHTSPLPVCDVSGSLTLATTATVLLTRTVEKILHTTRANKTIRLGQGQVNHNIHPIMFRYSSDVVQDL